MRVLVVEDEPSIRLLIDRVLTPRGHHVLTASSAGEAMALLLDFPTAPDVAVLDLVLPGMGGLTYSERLRDQFPGIRLIFMAGWTDGAPVEAALAHGPVVRKPFTPGELRTVVESNN